MISVIMPAYNAERTIKESINSVLAQSFPNWELVIIDDGSIDQTRSIVEEYVRTDPRVKLLTTRGNTGASSARNMGIDCATGRYIAFLDADDLWHSDKLGIQISAMEKCGGVFSYTSYKKVDESGKIGTATFSAPKSMTYKKLLRSNVIGCLTVMYDKAFFPDLRFPLLHCRNDLAMWLLLLKKIGHEDYSFWLNAVNRISVDRMVVGLPNVLAYYRVHSGTLSSNKLKAAAFQWIIYRNVEKLPFIKCVAYFISYAFFGAIRKLRK